MNENYLQFIWKVKRLPFHLLKTTTNESIEISNVGIHNYNDSGPDFLNGKINFKEIEWFGNIEIHIKSSDWYKHNHQLDAAYNNVILHVVYEHDCDVIVEGEKLPTIELKEYIDLDHYHRWSSFAQFSNEINCKKSIQELDRIYLESMMERAIIDRISRKVFFLKQDQEALDENEMLYFLIARAFGAKVNQFPFEELAMRLPIRLLNKYSLEEQRDLIQVTSGLSLGSIATTQAWMRANRKNAIGNVSSQAWKRKGLHAASTPERRVAQFAEFVQLFDFNLTIVHQTAKEIIDAFYKLIPLSERNESLKFTKELIHSLLINAVVPYLWWLGDKSNHSTMQDTAIQLLEMLPAEKNAITLKWKNLGIQAITAFESQALIELYNEHCSKNKCLSCEIGVKILNR